MLRRLALALALSTALVSASVSPSKADPVTGAVAAFAATPIGGIVTNLVVGFAATAFEGLIQNAFKKPATTTTIGTRLSVGTSGDGPQTFILGDYVTAGTRCYRGVYGQAGDTPNAYYVDERILSDLPLGRPTGFWVGDQKCTVLWDEGPAEQGYPVLEFRRNGKDYLWVWAYDGTQSAAHPYMLAKFGAHPTRPYEADMVGYGQAGVIVTALADRAFFPSGEPQYKFETDGIALYNPARDSTIGGVGSHRRDDPGTWEPSNLLPVHIYNILMGIRWGSEWMFGLQASTRYQLPVSNWIAAINAAATPIALAGGGTEPQYAGGLEVPVSASAAEVIQELLKGCSGRMAEIGGIYKILCGAPGASVYQFTDANVVITREQESDPFPILEETFNAAQASYPEPANGWAMKDAPGYFTPALEIEDGNRRLVANVTFQAVSSGTQVQRLLKAMVEEDRLFRRHHIVLPPEASELEPLDVVSWSSTRNGYTDKAFLITAVDDEPTFLQAVSLLETDPASFEWNEATDEQAYSAGFLEVSRPAAQVMTGWTLTPATIADDTGAGRRAAVEVGAAAGLADVRAVRVQLREGWGANRIIFDGEVPYDRDDAAPSWVIGSSAILPGKDYEGRGRYLPYTARSTLWSNQDEDGTDGPWLGVTTPVVGVEKDDLGTTLKALTDWFQASVNDLFGAFDSINATLQDQDAANYDDKRQVLASLTAKYKDSLARIESEASARADADSATASIATAAQASVDNISATGLWKMEALATPAGVDVKIGQSVQTDVAGTVTKAFETLEIDNTGKSTKTFVADVIQATNPDGTYLWKIDLAAGTSFEGSLA